METDRIVNRKISDMVAEKIEEWIRSEKVQPGEKLPSVRELCERFEVGRSAVRDAITTMKGKGLVDVRRGEGTFVCTFDCSQLFDGLKLLKRDDMEKLFQVRKLLEAGIAETAAIHRTPDDLLRMKRALDSLKQAETVEGWKADLEFHLSIAAATQNEILVLLMQTISGTLQKAMIDCHRVIVNDKTLHDAIMDQHESIYILIEQGAAECARDRMMEHLAFVESLLVQVDSTG